MLTHTEVHEAVTETAAGNMATILLVDDDEPIRRVTGQLLTALGYKVVEAEHAADAVRLLDSICDPVHALVTDVYMPGMRGSELVNVLREKRPELRALLMSGYGESDMMRSGVDTTNGFLHKPFGMAELRDAVACVLAPTKNAA